ncbi:MAG TPA: carbamoyltransferase [Vicinamibacterales bacterium]|nr:carbamoyltransferase [Vicinamibacterales bacterium]
MAAARDIYLLGITCNIHESSAALVKNGTLIAAAEEERFTRRKNERRFPVLSLAYCLREAGISMRDVGYAGFYWQPWKGLLKRLWWLVRYFPASLQTFEGGKPWRGSVATLMRHIAVPFTLWRMGFRGRFFFVDHHLAHAASAFLVSPHESAAILTVDLCGENCTTLVGRGLGNHVTPVRRFFLPHSLGIFYAALTQFLGYAINGDEFKVMGLAAYGRPRFADTFAQMVRFEGGRLVNDSSWFSFHTGSAICYSPRFLEAFGAPCPDEQHVEAEHYKDVAASGQAVLESLLLKLATWCKEQTGEQSLCMAGGVALNAVANGRILEHQIFRNIWIQPAAGDAGCSLGIPFYIWHEVLGHPRGFVMEHAYWGPEYSESEIQQAIRCHGLEARRVDDVERQTARLLAAGRVIGWYQGRMEWGPRALGNRSILADPRRADMKDLINTKVKFREPYRPFAPSVLAEDVAEYFQFSGAAPYMTIVCRVRDERQDRIPAVTHVDGTARIQTVSRTHNPRYWTLIDEFKALTGVAVVLNTSFNVKGEPIVCTPADAVRCFLETDLDYLVMGNTICSR